MLAQLVLCLALASARAARGPEGTALVGVEARFAKWKADFGKAYHTEAAHAAALAAFAENALLAERLSSAHKETARYDAASSPFADTPAPAFEAARLMRPWRATADELAESCLENGAIALPRAPPSLFSAPTSFDWTDHGAVTTVKDQKQARAAHLCGSRLR